MFVYLYFVVIIFYHCILDNSIDLMPCMLGVLLLSLLFSFLISIIYSIIVLIYHTFMSFFFLKKKAYRKQQFVCLFVCFAKSQCDNQQRDNVVAKRDVFIVLTV